MKKILPITLFASLLTAAIPCTANAQSKPDPNRLFFVSASQQCPSGSVQAGTNTTANGQRMCYKCPPGGSGCFSEAQQALQVWTIQNMVDAMRGVR